MSLRNNLHVLRVDDQDPNPATVFELGRSQNGKHIVLYMLGSTLSSRSCALLYAFEQHERTHKIDLHSWEEAVRELEVCLNIFRLQIERLEPESLSGKRQDHVQDVLDAVLAGMRHHATLANSRVLAVASVSSVAKVTVRIVGISPEVARIAATREAGHPAVR